MTYRLVHLTLMCISHIHILTHTHSNIHYMWNHIQSNNTKVTQTNLENSDTGMWLNISYCCHKLCFIHLTLVNIIHLQNKIYICLFMELLILNSHRGQKIPKLTVFSRKQRQDTTITFPVMRLHHPFFFFFFFFLKSLQVKKPKKLATWLFEMPCTM